MKDFFSIIIMGLVRSFRNRHNHLTLDEIRRLRMNANMSAMQKHGLTLLMDTDDLRLNEINVKERIRIRKAL